MQLIYTGEIKTCLPNVEFPCSLHVTYSKNIWANQFKATEHFKKVIFPYWDRSDQRKYGSIPKRANVAGDKRFV